MYTSCGQAYWSFYLKEGVGQVHWLHISHNVPIDTFITVGNVKEKVFFMVLLQHRNRDEEFRDASFFNNQKWHLMNSTDITQQAQKVQLNQTKINDVQIHSNDVPGKAAP